MATSTKLWLPRPAMTPPTAPASMPTMHTVRLENLLAKGTTNRAATAMGMAPRTDRTVWARPQSMVPVAPMTHSQK